MVCEYQFQMFARAILNLRPDASVFIIRVRVEAAESCIHARHTLLELMFTLFLLTTLHALERQFAVELILPAFCFNHVAEGMCVCDCRLQLILDCRFSYA